MTTPPAEPTGKKKSYKRWLLLVVVSVFAWSGWRAYAFRSALADARALGWAVHDTDPVESIRMNWKSAFEKETWLDGVTYLGIPTSQEAEQHLDIVHRLNPRELRILDAATLRDLSTLIPLKRLKHVVVVGATGLTNVDGLKNLSSLQVVNLIGCTGLTNVDVLKNLPVLEVVWLDGCTGLTNVDALKSLSALEAVDLSGCTGLTNVDVLKNLPALKEVNLNGCTGLTAESVAALKAALPNAEIYGP